ncbi:MAG TPA: 2-C-methyl-D-erythritol 4-phosphate cytidylyltransferase [Mycobacteriales bacterium]|nr:2-C-methyl-D-erythritol 4-phosphate cytidylyltransferase [Mycobacteriales bacterium]
MITPASGHRLTAAGLDCVMASTWDSVLPEAADIVVGQVISRPMPVVEVVSAVVAAVRSGAEVAVAAAAVTDTIKLRTPEGLLESTVDRSRLREVRSPWACHRGQLAGSMPPDPAGFAALPWTLGRPVTPVEIDAVVAAS